MVVFIGHGADRTGPPVFLANFQRWLSSHADLDFGTVLTRGGPLVEQYRGWGPVRILDPRWTVARVAQAGLARTGHPRPASTIGSVRVWGRLRSWRRAPVVYLNTASPATLRALPFVARSSRVIAHVHELEFALRYQLDESDRALLLGRPDCFVAASNAVAENLIERHGVSTDRVEVHHEFVEPVTPAAPGERRQALQDLGLPPDTFVVGASGMTEWRKGPDIFLRVAEELRRLTNRPLALLWVGGATAGPEWWPLDHEARHLGVDDLVSFLGPCADPGAWFRLFHVFALTSREDAFPLAALEAATAGVPLVTFDTGGMVEFAAHGGGVVVPYPDVKSFALELAALAADETRRRRLGATAAQHALQHHVPAFGARRLLHLIEGLEP